MKAAGIKARHKRRRTPGQLDSPVHAIAPNLLAGVILQSATSARYSLKI
jgi:hypothetical protein